MNEPSYNGLLMIGDPHLEGRPPGFRRDDYPNVVLDKLSWCFDYAAEHRLLPAMLGDLFHKPRDNPNWVLVRLLEMLDREVIGLYGNHDVHFHPELTDDDSLSVLVKAGRLRLVSHDSPWLGRMNGRDVIVAGSSYRQEIPACFDSDGHPIPCPPEETSLPRNPLVIWLCHHAILIPGYDDGRIHPREIPGVDLVVNGHIHRRLDEVAVGRTRWLTPGNISRRARCDATRKHVPAVLRIDISREHCSQEHVEVPHRPFDDVFHEAMAEQCEGSEASAFITGLAELQLRRTESGAGLMEFLQKNLVQFEPEVSNEILNLAKEVMNDGVNESGSLVTG